jgi:hypothetical protein
LELVPNLNAINLENVLVVTKNVGINTKKEWENIVEKVKKNVDKYPLISYIGYMKDREINIKVANITPKQWTNLVIELNLMAEAWKPYGPKIKLKTRNFDRIIKWGRSKNETVGKNRRSGSKLESNEEAEI